MKGTVKGAAAGFAAGAAVGMVGGLLMIKRQHSGGSIKKSADNTIDG